MTTSDSALRSVSPVKALREIAEAIPDDCRENMIVIGSLAVGYHYFAEDEKMVVRTKDADCLLSPRVQAVRAGVAITEQLMDAQWQPAKAKGAWAQPGSETTPADQLPAVRLRPPSASEWFLELLTVPETSDDRTRRWLRIETRHGHFGLPSFGFLALANFDPLPSDFGIFIARPDLMALANLLENPEIKPETMSGGVAGRMDIKRSNKDLGRVIAIARLAIGRDEDALLHWPDQWRAALQDRFPGDWQELSARVGQGLRALLSDEQDLDQAWYSCLNGLLASKPPGFEVFRIAGERLLVDAVEPMEAEET